MVFCKHCGTYLSDETLQCPKCQSHLSEFGHNSLSSSPNPTSARRSRLRWPGLALVVASLVFHMIADVLPHQNWQHPALSLPHLLAFGCAVLSIALGVVSGQRIVVVAGTLAVLAGAVMVPTFIIEHQAGPEASAVAQLRTINTAEVTYMSSSGKYGNKSELISAGLLDSRFEGPVYFYTFAVQASGSDYTATAIPTSTQAGRYGYFSLEDAVVRWADAAMKNRNAAVCNPCFPKDQSGNAVQ